MGFTTENKDVKLANNNAPIPMNCVENEVIPSQIVSISKDTDSLRNIIGS